ncbi:MAG: N-acetylneuraminate synthase family protein [Betaproteobacteria bacterium]
MRIKKLKDSGFNTDARTYVIAEIGINHGGDVALAERLIESAARTGVDAVKFQTYLTEKRAPKGNQAIFDILKKCELPFAAFARLKDCASAHGVEFFSTPFDRESVECLNSIGVNIFKVASFDVVNLEFLRELTKTGKPVIMSVGMADLREIDLAYKTLMEGTQKIALLHCISSYPLDEKDANLAAIYELQDSYDCVIGYSDHTPDIETALMAVAAGAQIIEKHFRIDGEMECIDAPVSITEVQARRLVEGIRRVETVFGDGGLRLSDAEKSTVVFRRISK